MNVMNGTYALVSLCALMFVSQPAQAAVSTDPNRYWDNTAGDNDWWNGNNWSPTGILSKDDDLVIAISNATPETLSQWITDNGGSITMKRSSSTATFGNNLMIGDSGTGNLSITSGTIDAAISTYFGYGSSGNGIGDITGSSSLLNFNALYSGYNGTGDLTIRNGADATGNAIRIGYNSGSDGTVTVTNTGSTLTGGLTTVGYSGTGRLEVYADASMSSNSTMTIGYNST